MKASIEMGIWALWAERESRSLSRALGGTRDTIPTGITIGIQDSPRTLVDKTGSALSRGYRKVTVCMRPGADIEYLGAAREALGADDLRRHAEFQDRVATPLCIDESITHLGAAENTLTLGAGRVMNIKAGRVGGARQAQAIHDLCQHHAMPAFCSGALETGIGRAYVLPLCRTSSFQATSVPRPATGRRTFLLQSGRWTRPE